MGLYMSVTVICVARNVACREGAKVGANSVLLPNCSAIPTNHDSSDNTDNAKQKWCAVDWDMFHSCGLDLFKDTRQF